MYFVGLQEDNMTNFSPFEPLAHNYSECVYVLDFSVHVRVYCLNISACSHTATDIPRVKPTARLTSPAYIKT